MFYCTILANKGDKKRKIAPQNSPQIRTQLALVTQLAQNILYNILITHQVKTIFRIGQKLVSMSRIE